MRERGFRSGESTRKVESEGGDLMAEKERGEDSQLDAVGEKKRANRDLPVENGRERRPEGRR